jgi:uncharacterized protein YgbK (DUF1537 family)
MPETKIIVLDDDPTGSQTVHGCLLLTRWDVETLRQGLADASPLLFILTNSRAMGAEQAAAVTREACHNLKLALAADAQARAREGRALHPLFVSRSDSTLRGHYPVETDVMAEELGPFDAHFLTPAFFEGGRITRDSIHYLIVNGQPVPTAETEFARDSVFGYRTSYLPDYVAEKTQGRIPASQVERFLLPEVRAGVQDRLLALHGNASGVVDAETQADLDRFAADVLASVAAGKRFLFRSAASLLTALARLPAQPVAPDAMREYVRGGRPGAVIVGSHVKKTTDQLERLLRQAEVGAVEIDVDRVPTEGAALLTATLARAAELHDHSGGFCANQFDLKLAANGLCVALQCGERGGMLARSFEPGHSTFGCSHPLGDGILGQARASAGFEQLVDELVFEFQCFICLVEAFALTSLGQKLVMVVANRRVLQFSHVATPLSVYGRASILCLVFAEFS